MCRLTPRKRQNSFAKGEHCKFEGQVTMNEDECQKSAWLKFRYSLGVSPLITRILAEVIAFGVDHLRTLHTSVTLTLTLDRVMRHTYACHSSTSTYTPNLVQIGKKLWTYGQQTDIESGFIWLA